MKVHRLLSILLATESKGTIKANELASELEVSLRTIYRDIDTLCEAGIPLTTTTGPNGGVSLMDGYTSGLHHLHEQDFINLYLSGLGIHPVKESDMAKKLNHTLLKLQQNVRTTPLNQVRKRFHFDEHPWWQEPSKRLDIDCLLSAMFQFKKLKIAYQKVHDTSTQRTIHPYGVVVKQMDWYMIAYCENSNEIRTFKCERIMNAEILDELFAIPQSFSLETFWKSSQTSFFAQCAENEQYPVLLSLHRKDTDRLSEFEVMGIEQEESNLLVTLNLYSLNYAKNVMFRLIQYAEVIEPIELRASLQETLQGLLETYTKPFSKSKA